MTQGKAITTAAGGAGVGALAGFTLNPELGFAIIKWLDGAIGAVGLVAILCLGAGLGVSVAGNWLMWNRLKEKDTECRAEIQHQRSSWKSVVDSKEADNKEMAKTVADLLVQVTLMVERLAPIRTRSP